MGPAHADDEILRIVSWAEVVKLAAEAESPEVLLSTVERCLKKNERLFTLGVLPMGFVEDFKTLLTTGDPVLAEKICAGHLKDVCEELKGPLTRAVDNVVRQRQQLVQ